MNENRLVDFLGHMQQAAVDACGFIEGLDKVVWETVKTALPELLTQLPSVLEDADNKSNI
ncbi:hypothetical protein [Pseudomonas sp. PLMAX]|uniref:hypothetical protein n=1 Tax=Pseudomonas sp. PLMAX TaxID=2201998 RepID=UPI0038B8AC1F